MMPIYQKTNTNVNTNYIDILCKVVDNYGDIGVAYRLARALLELESTLKIRLIIDNLEAFNRLEPKIDSTKKIQKLNNMLVILWDSEYSDYKQPYDKANIFFVIECFACSRPAWFESLLNNYADEQPVIINLEYLTAEAYAEELHCIRALSSVAQAKKFFFMPGFTAKTGGLILDKHFMLQKELADRDIKKYKINCSASLPIAWPKHVEKYFWVFVFTYEYDYTTIVNSLNTFAENSPVLVLLAAGMSQRAFLQACPTDAKFKHICLPFLNQKEWDRYLMASDFSLVRGEDSMSRAALSGKPFVWQAYEQKNQAHLTKVSSLLGTMEKYFSKTLYDIIANIFIALNSKKPIDILPLLANYDKIKKSYFEFSNNLINNGNLAKKILEFRKNNL